MTAIPKVSVIIPNYNGEKYLGAAIESLLVQSSDDFEFIILDDCSCDKSVEIISGYSDKRIRFIQSGSNIGNAAIRNIGIGLSKGKYIAVQDSDDISSPERLKKQAAYLDQCQDVDCIATQAGIIDAQGLCLGHTQNPVVSNTGFRTFLLLYNFAIHSSLMFRRDSLSKLAISYDDNLKYACDYRFMVDLCKSGIVHTLNERLVDYRKHDCSLTQKNSGEQNIVADAIRLSQLSFIGIFLNHEEEKVYLDCILNKRKLTRPEQLMFENIANKIVAANNRYGYFDQVVLSSIMDYSVAVNFHAFKGSYQHFQAGQTTA